MTPRHLAWPDIHTSAVHKVTLCAVAGEKFESFQIHPEMVTTSLFPLEFVFFPAPVFSCPEMT